MERDLLPWILGGALIATGAVAAVIEFGHYPSVTPFSPASTASAGSPPAQGAFAASTATIPAPIAAVPAAAPRAMPASASASTPATPGTAPGATMAGAPADVSHDLPAGEVWQCIVNGQKVFSDKRCGNGASVRQIGDLNVMDTPAAQPVPYGAYRSGYAGAPYPSAPYPDDQDDTGNAAGDVYAGPAFIVARERARREHLSRQDNHVRPPPNRGASGSRTPH
jgi:hypothetical protein